MLLQALQEWKTPRDIICIFPFSSPVNKIYIFQRFDTRNLYAKSIELRIYFILKFSKIGTRVLFLNMP